MNVSTTWKENFVVGGVALIFFMLLFAAGDQFFVLNPAADSARHAIAKETHQTKTLAKRTRKVACAQAESTANAFRFRQIGPHDKTESVEHFRTRMLAQRHVLLAAVGLHCQSAPGFPPFGLQVVAALRAIDAILTRTAPPSEAEGTALHGDHAASPTLTDAPTSGSHPGQTSTPTGGQPAHPGAHPSPTPTNPGATQPPPPSESPSSTPAPETSAPTSPVAEPESPAAEPPESGPVRSTVESALGLVCSLAHRLAGLC